MQPFRTAETRHPASRPGRCARAPAPLLALPLGFTLLAGLCVTGAADAQQQSPAASSAAKITLVVPEWQAADEAAAARQPSVLRDGSSRSLCLRGDQAVSYRIAARGTGDRHGFELRGPAGRPLGYALEFQGRPSAPPTRLTPDQPIVGVPPTPGCRAETAPSLRFSLADTDRPAATRDPFTGAAYLVVAPE